MKSFTLIIPRVPVSQNSKEWRSHWPRARYKAEWERDAWALCKEQRIPIHQQVKLSAVIYFPDKRRRDLDNYHCLFKGVQDGIVDAGVIPADDVRYIPETPTLRFDCDKANPRTEVILTAV